MSAVAEKRPKPVGETPRRDDEKRMELTEHLSELRSRIIRSILYVIAAAIGCYFLFEPLYGTLFGPMAYALHGSDARWGIMFQHFTEPFMLVVQISVVAGFIVAAPLLTAEMWAFIAPALTREERGPIRWVAPFSIVLFLCGVALGYSISRVAIDWFLGFLTLFPSAALYQNPKVYAVFMLKLMAVFGVLFQLPVVLMFLAWAGIVTSGGMKRYWRHAMVAIAFVGLLVTPSPDPISMLLMITPVMALYLASIGLVRRIEVRRARRLAL
ncbi:MAG TPA: twin-arginine translocase subunit TatC [Chthonomonadales bacterium]|nr:twin-arginine translocase subunit TatC [Chthonomonadales bacterium]